MSSSRVSFNFISFYFLPLWQCFTAGSQYQGPILLWLQFTLHPSSWPDLCSPSPDRLGLDPQRGHLQNQKPPLSFFQIGFWIQLNRHVISIPAGQADSKLQASLFDFHNWTFNQNDFRFNPRFRILARCRDDGFQDGSSLHNKQWSQTFNVSFCFSTGVFSYKR